MYSELYTHVLPRAVNVAENSDAFGLCYTANFGALWSAGCMCASCYCGNKQYSQALKRHKATSATCHSFCSCEWTTFKSQDVERRILTIILQIDTTCLLVCQRKTMWLLVQRCSENVIVTRIVWGWKTNKCQFFVRSRLSKYFAIYVYEFAENHWKTFSRISQTFHSKSRIFIEHFKN